MSAASNSVDSVTHNGITLWDRTVNYLNTHWISAVEGLIQIIVLFIIAKIVIRVGLHIANRTLDFRGVKMDSRRKDTMRSLVDNVLRYVVYFIFVIMTFQIVGFHIEALLAGAGIAGLAIGFGAQSIIKDILTGLFILFEDQYGVGDTVQINGFTGTVKSIGLRLTRVQAWTGEIEIIPNGQVTNVTNYSRANSIAVIDVGVSYKTSVERASSVLLKVLQSLKDEDPNIIGNVSIAGVQALNDSSVVIRGTAECLPMTQYGVQRKVQERIKEAFEHHDIEIPFPHRTVIVRNEDQSGGAMS